MTSLAPQPVAQDTSNDDELGHVVCCAFPLAMCGVNVSTGHECPDDLSCGCLDCVVCTYLAYRVCQRCGS